MQTKLQQYFPMLRSREEILREIDATVKLTEKFYSWREAQRQEFLDFCTGVRGIKMLYDSFFKEIINPGTVPERLEEFLSILLNRSENCRCTAGRFHQACGRAVTADHGYPGTF